jgi:non-specific serine/threonine protein kinase
MAMYQGDYPAARALQEQALAIYRRLGERRGIARVLINLGMLVAEGQADLPAAQSLFEEALAILRELGDQQSTSTALTNLGLIAHLRGEHAAAQALYEAALAIQQTLGDQETIAALTNNLGAALCLQGDHARGQAKFKEALAIWAELDSKVGLVSSLDEFAGLAWHQGQAVRAARLWGRTARLREEIGLAGSPTVKAEANPQVAAARAALGDAAFEQAWAEGRALALDRLTQELLAS